MKHRQSSRKRRERPKEKENEKKDERVEKETDETRKEESSVTLEGSVLNSDSQLNDTFTISPEQHSVLQHRHTHTDQDALEGTVTAAEEPLGPANKVVFEQLVEPAETKTSPRKDMQTAASPYSLQRTNRSAVFGPPINFKEEVGGKGGQERHSDRQWGRRDEVLPAPLNCLYQSLSALCVRACVCARFEGIMSTNLSSVGCFPTTCTPHPPSEQDGAWPSRRSEGICHASNGHPGLLAGESHPSATCNEGDSCCGAEPAPPASLAASCSGHWRGRDPPPQHR